jgi:hypothetical protein
MKFKKQTVYHFWVPNLFEYKGGIQVYLQDFLRIIVKTLPHYTIVVFNKLDKIKPEEEFEREKTKFVFSGGIPTFWRSFHFAFNLIMGALKARPDLIICGHINFSPIAFWLIALQVFRIGFVFTALMLGIFKTPGKSKLYIVLIKLFQLAATHAIA